MSWQMLVLIAVGGGLVLGGLRRAARLRLPQQGPCRLSGQAARRAADTLAAPGGDGDCDGACRRTDAGDDGYDDRHAGAKDAIAVGTFR